jgi:hypothetical protein
MSAEIQKLASEPEIPKTVTYTQIYATADQETHFRNVTVKLISTPIPPTQPVGFSAEEPATTIRFASFPAHWGDYDRENNILHTPSSRRFISLIQGNIWIKTSDGETRRFEPGNVVETLDYAPSKGNLTWVGGEPAFALFSNHS